MAFPHGFKAIIKIFNQKRIKMQTFDEARYHFFLLLAEWCQ